MSQSPKSLIDQVAHFTLVLVLVVVGLTWAWDRLSRLLPVAVGVAVFVVVAKVVQAFHRHSDW